MDGVFSLPEATRIDFLRSLMQSFGCAYICLWQSYDSHLSNRLFFLDGLYNVTNNQSTSSLGSISAAGRLFNLYQRLTFDVNDDCVPGLAFRNHMPYLELQQLDLLRLASTVIQTQFFQEARIESLLAPYSQTAIFMGCNKGEIELGFSTMPQIDIQTALASLFREDFYRQSQPIDQNPPSSSSSSWRSLSTVSRSPECSSLLFSIAGTSQIHFPETLGVFPTILQPVPATETSPQQPPPPIQALSQVIRSHFPTPEGEHDAIVRAILHVTSSPSSSTSHQQHQPHQNLPHTSMSHTEASAFKIYRPDIAPNTTPQMGANLRGQSLMKRSIAFSRSLHFMRMRERFQAARPPGSQLHHHMISERRRREKMNERFWALRALLPPGTKKDKASILAAARETLKALIAEIEKLNIRNQQLTTLLSSKEACTEETNVSSSNERLNIRVSHVLGSSSSEERMVDLQVIVRGESSQADILIRLLEFLKRGQNVSLISIGANTHITEGTAINQINFRVRIVEGSEWDESAFQEAVRRVVADLIH